MLKVSPTGTLKACSTKRRSTQKQGNLLVDDPNRPSVFVRANQSQIPFATLWMDGRTPTLVPEKSLECHTVGIRFRIRTVTVWLDTVPQRWTKSLRPSQSAWRAADDEIQSGSVYFFLSELQAIEQSPSQRMGKYGDELRVNIHSEEGIDDSGALFG
jgi:hypothetical protein